MYACGKCAWRGVGTTGLVLHERLRVSFGVNRAGAYEDVLLNRRQRSQKFRHIRFCVGRYIQHSIKCIGFQCIAKLMPIALNQRDTVRLRPRTAVQHADPVSPIPKILSSIAAGKNRSASYKKIHQFPPDALRKAAPVR